MPLRFSEAPKRQLRKCVIFSPDGGRANRRWKLAQLVEQLPVSGWLPRALATESCVVIRAVVFLNVRQRLGLSPGRAHSPIGQPSSGAIPQSARPLHSHNYLRCPTSRPSRSATVASRRRALALLQNAIYTASLSLSRILFRELNSNPYHITPSRFMTSSRIWFFLSLSDRRT